MSGQSRKCGDVSAQPDGVGSAIRPALLTAKTQNPASGQAIATKFPTAAYIIHVSRVYGVAERARSVSALMDEQELWGSGSLSLAAELWVCGMIPAECRIMK